MLTVGGKEVIFSTSFLMAPNDEAVLAPPELHGASMRLHASARAGNPGDFRNDIVGMEARMAIPFMPQGGSFSVALPTMAAGAAGKATARLAAQGLGGCMVVYLDVYRE
jgi:hypothetical protein